MLQVSALAGLLEVVLHRPIAVCAQGCGVRACGGAQKPCCRAEASSAGAVGGTRGSAPPGGGAGTYRTRPRASTAAPDHVTAGGGWNACARGGGGT